MPSLLRSLLIIPALDSDALRAAQAARVDGVLIDLEEGVPTGNLEAARGVAREAASWLRSDTRGVWVRTHSTHSLLARADIRATISPDISGYVLPHAQSANHLRYVESLVRDAEAISGIEEGKVRLIAMIESAEGLLTAAEIAKSSSRLMALALDGEDFCQDMGVHRTRDGHELQYARAHIAVCARAANLLAVDSPYPFAYEAQGMLADVSTARALGLHGKLVLSTEQATVANAVFRPRAEEIAYARRLEAAHAEARERGDEYPHIDGRVIDAPAARRARRLIELATAIEASEQQAAI